VDDQTETPTDTAPPPAEPDIEATRGTIVERLRASAPPLDLVVDGKPQYEPPEPEEAPATVRRQQVWYMSRGADVEALQEQLATLGLYPIDTDDADDYGLFGNTTDASVRGFQRLVGLPDSGVVDEATWLSLAHAARGKS
jgi:peptidoglycan hydrolase-like protein with peptidoglycan-binding domain